MQEIEFQQGVRKANKALYKIRNLPLKLRTHISLKRSQRCLGLVLDDIKEPSPDCRRDFYKGMFLAFSYYVQFGQYLDERTEV